MIPYVVSGKDDNPTQTLTFFAKGEQHTVARSHNYFGQIKDILVNAEVCIRDEADLDELIALSKPIILIEKAVAKSVRAQRLDAGVVEVRDGQVLFDGEPVHGHLVDRILEIALVGSVTPWVNFMTNLMQNPSFVAQKELYLWLEKANLPVTPDGHFLAYKKVSEEFLDLHTRTLDYSPGKVVEMPRHKVDDDRNNLCSSGLHFCSAAYLPHFGSYTGDKVVLVKINPADVVSIPSDYDDAKGRAWRIEVIEDVTEGFAAIAWPPVATNTVDWGANIDDDEFDDDAYDFEVDDDYYDDGEDYDMEDDDTLYECTFPGCDGTCNPAIDESEFDSDDEAVAAAIIARLLADGIMIAVPDNGGPVEFEAEDSDEHDEGYPPGYDQDNWDVRYVDADVYNPPESASFEPYGLGF